MRRGLTGASAVALLLVLVAACGGGEASPSPSASTAPSVAPTTAPATTEPSTQPAPSVPVAAERLLAACEGVAIRTEPAPTAELLTRVAKLTKVRVAETVEGEAYTTGACGTSGSDWMKIDRVNGTSVKKLYGVPFAYAARGFFE